jgi:threonine dehydrogenase-like Zn-dependent dehydrogenase
MKGAKVGILGFGPIGMSVQLPAIAKGAEKVYVTDKIDGRLKIAGETGAAYAGNVDKSDIVKEILELEPRGLDVVFECCGKQEAIEQAFDLLKPGGVLMLIGIPEFDMWSFPVDKGRHKELNIKNVRRQNGALEETLEMLENRSADISKMPTHRFSFADSKKAFDLVARYGDGVMKAMIDF